METVTRTYQELKRNYEEAAGHWLTTEQLFDICNEELESEQAILLHLSAEARECLDNLNRIAE